MTQPSALSGRVALIVGTGPGLSASLARLFHAKGLKVALAARNTDKISDLVKETNAKAYSLDASEITAVQELFAKVETELGVPEVVVYNASGRVRGPIESLDPAQVQKAINVAAFGGFLVSQEASKRMLKLGRGAILLTGASASVKGFANSSSFAMVCSPADGKSFYF